jgi:carbamoyltransferase
MGLAAFGKAPALRDKLRMVELLPNGSYEVDWNFVTRLQRLARPRRCDDEITEFHADLAATVQESLEEAVLHILRNARKRTGHTRVCFAGGVAHNCSLNGKIAETEQFAQIFVHPASHDAGCALGAALAVECGLKSGLSPRRLRTVFWGTAFNNDEIKLAAERWQRFVVATHCADFIDWAAERMANGAILGWVQGQAEFGPRALGHRSLLADPRPAVNKDRINSIIKKREQFRPFAPVVQAEHASQFFAIPPGVDCSFMSFAVPVHSNWRASLAAVTHEDGTARVQTITREQDLVLWTLLERFSERTAIPMLLNTSLNIAREPIVDSLEDVITCVLTTEIEAAVVSSFVIKKIDACDRSELALSLPDHVRISQSAATAGGERIWILEGGGPDRSSSTVSESVVDLLRHADGQRSIAELASATTSRPDQIISQILELWGKRLLRLAPPEH